MARSEIRNQQEGVVDLIPIASPGDRVEQGDAEGTWRGIVGTAVRRHLLLVLTVILPTLCAVIYFGLFVADRYQSETRFVVRIPGKESSDPFGSLLQSSVVSRASDESYLVQEFLKSRDATRVLMNSHGLRDVLARPEADFIWRFPSLFGSDREERLHRHFQSFVTVELDRSTGISLLKVQAFRPNDASVIARAMIDAAERLVNQINERSRNDTLRAAQDDVEMWRQRATAARERLTDFRGEAEMIDPTRSAAPILQTMARLSLELAQASTQLTELLRASPLSPLIGTLRTRIASLEEQLARERRGIGGNSQSLAPRIAEFERLVMAREFADRGLASALTSLEAARVQAQRQQIYLERLVEPRPTDYPEQPYRVLSILISLLMGFCVFAIVRTVARNVREHSPR